MAADGVSERTLTLCFSILGLVSFVAILGRFLFSLPYVLGLLKWLLATVTPAFRCNETHEAIWHLAREELLQRKVRNFRNLLQIYSVGFLLGIANILVNSGVGKQRLHSLTQDAVVAVGQLLTLLVCLRPRVVTAQTLDLFYVSNMVLAALYVAPFATNSEFLLPALLVGNSSMAIFNIFRRTIAQRKAPVMLLCNLAFLTCANKTILENERFGANATQVVYLQTFIVCTFIFGAVCLEAGFASTLEHTMQLEEVKELHAAGCALLRSVCECTVELDAEGVIASSCEELGSYLMKGGFSHSLEGRQFAEFLVDEEEKDLFQVRLKESKMKRIGLAETMPASMKDACGNLLRLELLWFEFRRIDKSLHYMLGLREMSECKPNSSEALPHGSAPAGTKDTFNATLSCSSSVTSDDPGAAILVVDTVQDGFPVVGQTQALTAMVGRLPKGGLLADFVKKPGRFMRWVQAAVVEEQPNTGAMTFILPWGRFRAQCKVLIQQDGKGAESLERVGLLITSASSMEKKGRTSDLKGTPSSGSCAIVAL